MTTTKYSALLLAFLLISLLFSFHCNDNPVVNESALTLTSPNGGEHWQVGTTQTISWTSKNISGDVKIDLSTDGGVTYAPLFSGTPNTGHVSWYIPGPTSTNAEIRVVSLNDANVSDASNNAFTIFEVLTAPTNLLATLPDPHSVALTWSDQSSNEQGFVIERMVGLNGGWLERARVSANVITYKDSLLGSSQEYFYRVHAYSANGISSETNTISKIIGWVQQQSTTTQTLYGVYYLNATTGVAVGQGGTIIRTTDGGDDWSSVSSGTANDLYDVTFSNTQTGLAVGTNGTVLRTNNGGTSWSASVVGGASYKFTGADFATSNDVFLVGYRADQVLDSAWGEIFHSTDAGISWSVPSEHFRYQFSGVSFTAQNTGTIVGSVNNNSNSAIFRTTNGGSVWSEQSDETHYPLLSVNFLDANNGWTVGIQGTILHTTNGGTNWTDQSYATVSALRRVAFADVIRGISVGDNGLVVRTTDGGSTWNTQTTGSSVNFFGLSLSDANTQTLVGAGGVIIKTNNGGVQ